MPLSTVYNVRTKYSAETRTAERRVDTLSRKAERHAEKVEKAKRAWGTFGTVLKGIAFAAVTVGLGMVARRMMRLTKAAQDAKIQIAAVFEQSNPGKFEKNLARAGNLYKRFQTSAITSPATSSDFLSIFKGSAPVLAPMGLSDDLIDQFVSRAVPAGLAYAEGDYDQAGRDMLQILQGRGGTDVKTFLPLKADLLKNTGTKTTEEFNKFAQSNPRKTFDALNKALEGMDVVNKEYATSFGGLLASVTEFADSFLRTMGGPIMKQLSKTLQRTANWFQENEDKVAAIGEMLGDKVATGLRVAEKLSKMILENFQGILIVGSAIAAKKIFGVVGTGLSMAGGSGVGARMAANVASASAVRGKIGAGVGGAVRGGGGFMMDIVSEAMFGGLGSGKGGGKGGALVRSIKGGAGKIKGGLAAQIAGKGVNFGTLSKGGALGFGGKLATGASAMAGGGLGMLKGIFLSLAAGASTLAAILLPLIVVVGMVVGTFRVLKDGTNEATQFFRNSVDELMVMLDTIAAQFGGSGGFVQGLKDFADWLGTGVVGVLGIGVKIVERLASAISHMFAVFKGVGLAIGRIVDIIMKDGVMRLGQLDMGALFSNAMAKAMKDRDEAELQAMRDREKRKKEKKEEEEKGDVEAGGNPPAQVNVTINQDIKTDSNPDRIAFRVGEVIGDVARKFPRSASGVVAR